MANFVQVSTFADMEWEETFDPWLTGVYSPWLIYSILVQIHLSPSPIFLTWLAAKKNPFYFKERYLFLTHACTFF